MDVFESLNYRFSQIDSCNFQEYALDLFQFQVNNNKIYQEYVAHLSVDPAGIKEIHQIPFLPIEFFKNYNVKSGNWEETLFFESSGTSQGKPSRHLLPNLDLYHQVSISAFEQQYGPLDNFHILALLPSYLERDNSSLVSMVAHFIQKSNSTHSGFYLHNPQELIEKMSTLTDSSRKILLIGVSFALLDLAEKFDSLRLPDLIIMETGGMKGRRLEITREDLHERLQKGFGVDRVHSEYGMTEILSQAYSRGKGEFITPPWMRVIVRDIYDPFQLGLERDAGGINIVDLANLYSCAFIETQDIGVSLDRNRFKVLGRMDNSDVRGCNLMVH